MREIIRVTDGTFSTVLISGAKKSRELVSYDNLGIDTSTYPILTGQEKKNFFEQRINSLSPFWNLVLRYPSFADVTPFKVGEQNCHAAYLKRQLGSYPPILDKSLTQEYMNSNGGFKRLIFSDCEQLLINAFGEAKDFLPEGMALQQGFFVSGLDEYTMGSGETFGVEVSYTVVEGLIKEVSGFYSGKWNGRKVSELYQLAKGVFAHEMVHDTRIIKYDDENESEVESEIAPCAIEYLATWDYNPIYVRALKRAFIYEDISADIYHKARAAGLRVIYSRLADLAKSGRFEKPDSYEPIAIQRCIGSIPESIRVPVIRKISKDIIRTSGSKLMKLAEKVKKQS